MKVNIKIAILGIFLFLLRMPGQQERALASMPAASRREWDLTATNLSLPPATIRVRITGTWECDLSAPYTVETINFNEYVKNVLPNEWDGSWPYEAYKAGAVAVKMYAWYWIAHGGKWSDADVYDSVCDQVYKPGTAYGLTDRAVDETWYWALLSPDDQPFQAYHKNSLYQCGPPLCMSQTSSKDQALEGNTWDQILLYFYPNTKLASIHHTPAGNALELEIDPAGTGFRIPLSNLPNADYKITGWLKIPVENALQDPNPCPPSLSLEIPNNGQADPQTGLSLKLSGSQLRLQSPTSNNSEAILLCGPEIAGGQAWHSFEIDRIVVDGALTLRVDGRLESSGFGATQQIDYLEFALQGWIDELEVTDLQASQLLAAYHFDEGFGSFTYNSVDDHPILLEQPSLLGSIQWVLSDLFLHNLYIPMIMR